MEDGVKKEERRRVREDRNILQKVGKMASKTLY